MKKNEIEALLDKAKNQLKICKTSEETIFVETKIKKFQSMLDEKTYDPEEADFKEKKPAVKKEKKQKVDLKIDEPDIKVNIDKEKIKKIKNISSKTKNVTF